MVLLAALWGCANPISNEFFYADEAFLSALPSQERFGFSPSFARAAENVQDPGFLAGAAAAQEIDPLVSLTTNLSDILRSNEPDVREKNVREWHDLTLSTPDGSGPTDWAVAATIIRNVDDGPLDWTIWAAVDNGEPVLLGEGTHRPDQSGTVNWFFGDTAELLVLNDIPPDLIIDIAYQIRADGRRETEIEVRGELPEYTLIGDEVFEFYGTFDIHDDGVPLTGVGRVYVHGDRSGRAEGALSRSGPEGVEDFAFETCWINDNTVFALGDEGMPSMGVPADCWVPPIPE